MIPKPVCSIAFLFLIVAINASYGIDFPPPPVQKCRIDDENCWIEQSKIYLKTYNKGIPELNIKALDPMEIDDFVVKGNENGATAFNLAIKDMKMFDLKGTKVTSVKVLTTDPTKPIKLQLTLFVPQSSLKSKYTINGKILILPIRGEGDAIVEAKGTTVKVKVSLKFEKREDGKSYFNDVHVKVSTQTENANIYLSNLFNGDKDLSDNVLKVMNENWRLLAADFDPQVHKSLVKQTTNTLKTLLKDVAFEDMFLKESIFK